MKTILLITDGIGHNDSDYFNAFKHAKKPAFDYMFKNFATSLIKTSGKDVGLPNGQMGNSEVGHMSIGSGRILYQNLVRIDKAIEDKTLDKNEHLMKLFTTTKNIHIIGLYSDGGIHSHLNHFNKIYEISKSYNKKTYMHIITDGRDTSTTSAINFINNLNSADIATISGRFYAMDRDKRWERILKAYNSIVNAENKQNKTPAKYIQESYDNGITDEFIIPACFGNFSGISEEDGIIFINFRNDRMKEIVSSLGCKDFNNFPIKKTFKNLVTMTNYDDKFNFKVLFENEVIKNTLPEVIANANLRQFHVAETEKYAHVTFFFNGGVEEPCINETRILVPSPKVKTYDELPQMSAYEVCDMVLKAMDNEEDFIVVNFANGDMVGHTGNFEASVKAVESVDDCIFKIIKKAEEKEYAYLQTSDHGNCEQMKDSKGNILTNHTTFDVYCFLKANGVNKINNGRLSNIAPTVLKLLNLPIPPEMDKPLF